MRTGIALSVLRNEVKLEAGESTNASHSTQRDAYIDHMLNTEQRALAAEFRWPALHFEVEVTLVADQLTYTLPATISPDRISEVWASYGDQWLPVTHSIGRIERSAYPSNVSSYPPSRFEFQPDDGSGTYTFEVWPKPSQGGTLRFSGQKTIADMSSDSDTCLIDADVLVRMVAGRILARNGVADAPYVMNQARKRARNILGSMTADIQHPISHGRRQHFEPVAGIDFIPPGYSD